MEKMERTLGSIVGKNYVSTEDFELWCYSRDFSPEFPKTPSIVVMPENTGQVSDIVKVANQTKTPIWPRGWNQLLCGSDAPERRGDTSGPHSNE